MGGINSEACRILLWVANLYLSVTFLFKCYKYSYSSLIGEVIHEKIKNGKQCSWPYLVAGHSEAAKDTARAHTHHVLIPLSWGSRCCYHHLFQLFLHSVISVLSGVSLPWLALIPKPNFYLMLGNLSFCYIWAWWNKHTELWHLYTEDIVARTTSLCSVITTHVEQQGDEIEPSECTT